MTIVNAVIEGINREPETYDLLDSTQEWYNLKEACLSKGWRGYLIAVILGEDWKTYHVKGTFSDSEWREWIVNYQSKGYTIKTEVIE